jgi:hypothetical protein
MSGTALLYTLGSSPIKTTEVEKALVDYPDQSIAKSLLNGLKFGFKLNYSGLFTVLSSAKGTPHDSHEFLKTSNVSRH